MATYIETKDINIFIDPGIALAPKRFGLPPHPIELERLNEDWEKVVYYAEKSDVIIITHYHYDHYNPKRDLEIIYNKKIVLLKDPMKNINYNQCRRGLYFIKQIEGLVSKLEIADSKKFRFNDTTVLFSKPVPHGVDTKLGFVLEVYIEDSKHSFLFTSDVEGPSLEDQFYFIKEMNPNVIYVDGPMTYMLGKRYPEECLNRALSNLVSLNDLTNLKVLIIDHHLLRDSEWFNWVYDVYESAKITRVWVGTAAEFMGEKPKLLEAYRKELYSV